VIIQKVRTFRSILAGKLWVQAQRFSKQLTVDPGVRVVGLPHIRTVKSATIELGSGVTLNSFRRGYHAGMFGPVVLIADRPGAVISVGRDSRINGAIIHAQDSVLIGARVLMAAQALVIDSNGHPVHPVENRLSHRDKPRPVVIEDDVWVGIGAVILPGAKIGRGSVIGANAVVTGTIPPNTIVRAEVSRHAISAP
jgi:acetyltransferase-like isoleucine patch superfamily enzyme